MTSLVWKGDEGTHVCSCGTITKLIGFEEGKASDFACIICLHALKKQEEQR